MSEKKRAGVRFENELYINFVYDPDTDIMRVYKNGTLITEGGSGGVTPEELAEILEAYVTKQLLTTTLSDYATKNEIPDITGLATKSELQAIEAEIPDITGLATKAELPIIKRGQTSAISAEAGSYTDQTITFDEPFSTVPTVQGTISSNSTGAGSGNLMCSIFNVNITGFTIRIFNNDNTKRSPAVQWIAIA